MPQESFEDAFVRGAVVSDAPVNDVRHPLAPQNLMARRASDLHYLIDQRLGDA